VGGKMAPLTKLKTEEGFDELIISNVQNLKKSGKRFYISMDAEKFFVTDSFTAGKYKNYDEMTKFYLQFDEFSEENNWVPFNGPIKE
jgi:hypothetical protein